MKTLRRPLTVYLFAGILIWLLYNLWGSMFPMDGWRYPWNALFNVAIGTLMLVTTTVVPSALATSLLLVPVFRRGHLEPERRQVYVFAAVGIALQTGLFVLIVKLGGLE